MLLSLVWPKYKMLLQLLCISSCLLICCILYNLPGLTTPTKIYVSQGYQKVRFNSHLDQFCPPGYSYGDIKSKIMEERSRRRHLVNDVCNRTTHKRRFRTIMARNILVDDFHRILYCVIPKVACTTWKKFFLQKSPIKITKKTKKINVHDWRTLRRAGYSYLHTYNQTEIHYRLNNYFKFLFVRDPFERLLSAYREKFQLHNKYTEFFHRTFGQTIISRYRHNSSRESRKAGNDVRFEEFIHYLLELKDRDEEFNPHWDSYYNLCYPCTIEYDFIGKLETMQQDSQFILQKISNSNTCQQIPQLFIRSLTSKSYMQKYYSKLSPATINELKELYSLDFKLFNYSMLTLDP